MWVLRLCHRCPIPTATPLPFRIPSRRWVVAESCGLWLPSQRIELYSQYHKQWSTVVPDDVLDTRSRGARPSKEQLKPTRHRHAVRKKRSRPPRKAELPVLLPLEDALRRMEGWKETSGDGMTRIPTGSAVDVLESICVLSNDLIQGKQDISRTLNIFASCGATAVPEALSLLVNVLGRCNERFRQQESNDNLPWLAESLLDTWLSDARLAPPDEKAYAELIRLWSRASPSVYPTAAARATHWLSMMRRRAASSRTFLPPRASLYVSVLAAWEKSSRMFPEAPYRADLVFRQLQSCQRRAPPPAAYFLLLASWSKSRLPEAPDQATAILHEIVRGLPSHYGKLTNITPAFVNVLSAWRRSGRSDAAVQASQVLKLMASQHRRNPVSVTLNDSAFNIVIDCWTLSESPDQVLLDRLNGILDEMDAHAAENPYCSPSLVTVWSASQLLSQILVGSSQNVVPMAMRLFAYTYATPRQASQWSLYGKIYERLLKMMARNSNSPLVDENAVNVMKRVEDMEDEISPIYTVLCYLHTSTCLRQRGHRCLEARQDLDRRMSMYIYRTSKNPSLLKKIEARLWNRLKHSKVEDINAIYLSMILYEDGSYKSLDYLDFQQVLDYLLAEHDFRSGEYAEIVLHRMQENLSMATSLFLNAQVFEKVMFCWLHSGHPNSVHRAVKILQLCCELVKEGKESMKPSEKSFLALFDLLESTNVPVTLDERKWLESTIRDFGYFNASGDRSPATT